MAGETGEWHCCRSRVGLARLLHNDEAIGMVNGTDAL